MTLTNHRLRARCGACAEIAGGGFVLMRKHLAPRGAGISAGARRRVHTRPGLPGARSGKLACRRRGGAAVHAPGVLRPPLLRTHDRRTSPFRRGDPHRRDGLRRRRASRRSPGCSSMPSSTGSRSPWGCRFNFYLGLLIFFAVILHKIPEGLTIASVMIAADRKRRTAFLASLAIGVRDDARHPERVRSLRASTSAVVGVAFAFSAGIRRMWGQAT